jgi:hypothetical protein
VDKGAEVNKTVLSRMKRLLWSLPLLWPLVGLADFEAGLAAYQEQDFDTALEEWRPLAEAGDLKARFYVGVMYLRGEGVDKDPARAYAWFDFGGAQTSAKQGEPSVQVIEGAAPMKFGSSALAVHLGSIDKLEGTFSLADAIRTYGKDYQREENPEGDRIQYTWSYVGTTLAWSRQPTTTGRGFVETREVSQMEKGACRLAVVTDPVDRILEVTAEGNACASVLDLPEVWRERRPLYITRPARTVKETAPARADTN